MTRAHKTHLRGPRIGRPFADDRCRALCGSVIPTAYLSDAPTCAKCARKPVVIDPVVEEAAKVLKRIYMRKRYRANPARFIAAKRQWYQRNAERVKADRREAYRIARESDRERNRKWKAANREHLRIYNRAYYRQRVETLAAQRGSV